MPSDYHMHLEGDDHYGPCPYTVERIARYVEVARRRGLDEIGISEHCYKFREFRPVMAHLFEANPAQHPAVVAWMQADFGDQLHRYVDAVLEAKARGLPVRLGIEVDFLPDRAQAIGELLQTAPWDYVLGSVHFVDGQCIDFRPDVLWPGADVERLYRRYFELLTEAASSGLFDVIAHLDLPKKFGARPGKFPQAAFEAFVKAAREAHVAVEINTAGLRKPAAEAYPAPFLLEAVVSAGIDVQLGSDAHEPEQVGLDFDRATTLARQAGVQRFVRWNGRVRAYEPF